MSEQWKELKETIIELRDSNGTGTQQEVCKFLVNYMGILEKQMQEPCKNTIDRQAVLDIVDSYSESKSNVEDVTQDIISDIVVLPPVNPQPSGDLISREETLTAFADYVGSGMSMNDYDALWNIVTKMPSVTPTQRWIPVSEPPKKDGKYLVTLRFITHDAVETAKYSNNLHKVDALDFPENKAGWYNYDSEYGYYEHYSIIAWMPLPEPYKAES